MNDSGESMVGRSLGRFDLVGEIGRGAMGEVYRAVERSSGRQVAVKVLSSRLTADTGFVERFRREAHATVRLDHPCIVSGSDLGEAEGIHYFAMQLVEGESLEEVLFDRGRLPAGEVAGFGIQVAEALSYAHGEGFVHRDIKPGNLLLEPSGRCLVTDFGIALAAFDTRLTLAGQTLGSPHYLAPEIVGGGQPDARSDLYALGVVLYQALTGELPYPGKNALAVLRQVLETPLPRVRQVDPSIPEEMDRIVAKLMARSPDERYQGGSEVLGDLHRLDSDETPPGTHSVPKEPRADPEAADPSRTSGGAETPPRRWFPARLALVLLLAALAMILTRFLGC